MKISYRRLYPVQIMSMLVAAINILIDSYITSHFLGFEAMAAISFFSPVTTVIGMSQLMISGIQILCARYIGYGERDRVKSLFTTGMLAYTVWGVTVTVLLISGRFFIPGLLGADEAISVLLSDYMSGYSFGVTGQLLCSLFITMLPLNNRSRLSYVGILAMILVNTTLDVFFLYYCSMGCFGMGLATSISYIVSALIMLFGFFGQDKALGIDLNALSFKDFPEAARLGLPLLFFNLGLSFKSFVMNNTLFANIGAAAVAVLNFQGSLCSLLGSVPLGCAFAMMVLGSIYYGEEDRESLIDCMKYTLKTSLILCSIIAALLMAGSSLISSTVFSPVDETYRISVRMLLIFPDFLVFNAILNVLTKSYNIIGHMKLVNILSFVEQIITAFIAVGLMYAIGIDGFWWSFTLGNLVCILIIGINVFVRSGRLTFKPGDWMMLDKDFGAGKDDYMEMVLTSMDEVIGMSEKVIEFCKSKGADSRKSFYAGLAIEEMAGNTVKYGFTPGKKNRIEVKVVKKEDMVIRIQDNCPMFDPKKRIDQFYPEDVSENIGIRMIAAIAKDMNYENNVGINTLLITL